MRIFIEDYMNMTLINHDDGPSAAIYRFVEYNVIVEYADYLKSLGYTFKHALAVASRGSVEQREGQTKEEADAKIAKLALNSCFSQSDRVFKFFI